MNEPILGLRASVRAATRDDIPAILEIYNDAILTTTASYDYEAVTLASREEWFARKAEGGWPVLVAEHNHAVQGFASFGPFRDWAGYLHTVEHSIYVASHTRRMGIGSALLPALIEAARTRGVHAMVGGIDVNNVASLRLHEKFGFEQVAHFKEIGYKFHRWLDLIFMEKLIGAAPPDRKT
jgi:phosphinothricin acetyltransferase